MDGRMGSECVYGQLSSVLLIVCLSSHHRQCAVSTRPPAKHTSTGLGAHKLGPLCRMTRLTRQICGKIDGSPTVIPKHNNSAWCFCDDDCCSTCTSCMGR